MPANFNLILDTTAPGGVTLELAGGALNTAGRQIIALVGCTDADLSGYQVKIWGDLDPTNNPAFQPLEGDSAWVGWNGAGYPILLSEVEGLKTIHIRVRDDVWNESAEVTDTITLTILPVITVAGPDVAKVSKVAGKRTASFSFTCNEELVTFEVRVVPDANSLHDAGTLIGTAFGSVNMSGADIVAGATVNCQIDGRDLEAASAGDGNKIIKVFGQDAEGDWTT